MARELFIWWKVAAADAAQAEAAVVAAQRQLRDWKAGLRAHLYRRHEAQADPVTLMEIYRCTGSDIDDALQAAIEARLAPCLQVWCRGGRHVEVFERIGA